MKKLTFKQLQDLIWIECRRIIKQRYNNTCYSCGATDLIGSNRHTGHMIAKKYLKNYLKYDLRLLRPQCYFCNIHCGGMGALFIENIRHIEGNKYVDGILKDLHKEIEKEELYAFYERLLDSYKNI